MVVVVEVVVEVEVDVFDEVTGSLAATSRWPARAEVLRVRRSVRVWRERRCILVLGEEM